MNLGDLFQRLGEKVPGHSWLSDSFLGDVVTGGLARGAERNDWRFPSGHDTTSFDDIAGAGASRTHGGRNLARGVGSLFAGGGLYRLLAGLGSAAGASEVGQGLPLAEEAGGSAAEGQLSGPASSPGLGWQDYMRYGRQASNLLSNMNMPGGQPMPVPPQMDEGMIMPPPQEPSYSALPPGLMTMLLAQAFQKQQGQPAYERPAINSGGIA